MEFFHKAKSVRLRSHHDKYLCAGDDEKAVTQDRDGSNRNARWQVEFIQGRPLIRLKSCYNRYLTATDISFLLGWTGKKVHQTVPSKFMDSSVEWEPVKDGLHVMLKTQYGTYLRANGFTKPWKNQVTHDIPHRTITQYWVFWEVELTEIHMPTSLPPLPQLDPSSPNTPNGRVIYYRVGYDTGDIKDGYEGPSFLFKGNDVYRLTKMLEEETGLCDFIVCAHHPSTGKLFPLALQLPPNNTPMQLVLLPPSN
ncbi:hypothetical protein KI387_017185, partial [Taxus chinensis]